MPYSDWCVVQVALETDGQWEEELDKMQQEFATESDRQLHDIERLNNQVLALEKEVNKARRDGYLCGDKVANGMIGVFLERSAEGLDDDGREAAGGGSAEKGTVHTAVAIAQCVHYHVLALERVVSFSARDE